MLSVFTVQENIFQNTWSSLRSRSESETASQWVPEGDSNSFRESSFDVQFRRAYPPPINDFAAPRPRAVWDRDTLVQLLGQILEGDFSRSPILASYEQVLLERFETDSSTRLETFLQTYPDPEVWFCREFSCVRESEVFARITPLGVVFHVEGYAYARFVAQEKIRVNATDPISLGVTLRLEKHPPHLHNLFVVVNRGDGMFGERSPTEISDTVNHEALHQVFNRYFCQAPFISSNELQRELMATQIQDRDSHRDLARRLSLGMVELSRSELISYFGTGYFNTKLKHLCGDFWRHHHHVVQNYLKGSENNLKKEIASYYRRGCTYYRDEVRSFIDFARRRYEASPRISKLDLIAEMLLYRSDARDNPSHSPTEDSKSRRVVLIKPVTTDLRVG